MPFWGNAATIWGRLQLLRFLPKVRPLFEGGYYLRAGTNNDFTVLYTYSHVHNMYQCLCWMYLPCMNCSVHTHLRQGLWYREQWALYAFICTNEVRPKYEELKWGRTKTIFFWLDYTKMEYIILQNKTVPFWPLGWTFMMTMATTTTNTKKEKTMSVYEKATFHHHLQPRVYCQSCHFQKKILFCTAGSIRGKRVVVYIQ